MPGKVASVVAEQAELVVPYLARYAMARWRAAIVPGAILVAVASVSWAAAVVLLFAAPLIPIFMALIGWRAEKASEAQLVEAGALNVQVDAVGAACRAFDRFLAVDAAKPPSRDPEVSAARAEARRDATALLHDLRRRLN